jgi:hypothetical protein
MLGAHVGRPLSQIARRGAGCIDVERKGVAVWAGVWGFYFCTSVSVSSAVTTSHLPLVSFTAPVLRPRRAFIFSYSFSLYVAAALAVLGVVVVVVGMLSRAPLLRELHVQPTTIARYNATADRFLLFCRSHCGAPPSSSWSLRDFGGEGRAEASHKPVLFVA